LPIDPRAAEVRAKTGINLTDMDDFPTRFADLLESIAKRVRALTTDRVGKWIRMSSLGLVAATLGMMAVIFLLLTIYGALAIPLGPDGAFGLLGGLVLVAGVVLWSKRSKVT
jgi:hypothetical protein